VPSGDVGLVTILVAFAVVIAAVVLEFTMSGRYARTYGGSRRAAWGAVVVGTSDNWHFCSASRPSRARLSQRHAVPLRHVLQWAPDPQRRPASGRPVRDWRQRGDRSGDPWSGIDELIADGGRRRGATEFPADMASGRCVYARTVTSADRAWYQWSLGGWPAPAWPSVADAPRPPGHAWGAGLRMRAQGASW